MRKTFAFLITVSMLFCAIPCLSVIQWHANGPLALAPATNGATRAILNVPGTYATIGAAIAAAAPGDTINVSSGTYPENVVIPVGMPLSIVGTGLAPPTIDGGGVVNTVTINADGSRLDNLRIIHSGPLWNNAGVRVNNDSCVIENCNVSADFVGISLDHAMFCYISNCTVGWNFAGTEGGLLLAGSDNNTLSNNTVLFNKCSGVKLYDSHNNTIIKNIITDNFCAGILLKSSANNTITDNTIGKNLGKSINDEGLVGYWKMDEGSWSGAAGEVVDSSGCGNSGTELNGANTQASGKYSRGGLFDGVNDAVPIKNNASLNNLNAITMEAWIYPVMDVHGHILDKGDGDKRLYLVGTSLALCCRVRFSGVNAYSQSVNQTVQLNTWQHVAMTWGAPDTIAHLYYNGTEVSYFSQSVATGAVQDDSDYPFYLGGRGSLWANMFFPGTIDEAKLYKRALTAQEIKDEYQEGVAGGFHLNGSNDNSAMGNVIQENAGYAVIADDSSAQNIIHHNHILGNRPGHVQAYDNGTSNHWDDGAEGNYWSDKLSPDNVAPFGIVDQTYDPDGTKAAKDRCPLCPAVIAPTNCTAYEELFYSSTCSIKNAYKPGTFTIRTNASWLSTSPLGTISGTPTNADVGTYWVDASMSDAYATNSRNFTLQVINVNDKPTITTSDVKTCNEESLYSVAYQATDVDPGPDILTWELRTNASFLSMNAASGLLNGTPDDKDVGNHWVNVSISDGHGGSDSTNFTLAVINVNDPPTIKLSVSNFSFNEDTVDQRIHLYDWFSDVDTAVLTFRCTGSVNISVQILPNGTVRLTPKANWSGAEALKFYANDTQYEASDSVTVTVLPVNDRPFASEIILGTGKFYVNGSQPAHGNASDVDIPYGDTLTFTWYSNVTGKIGTGQDINLSLPVGHHMIALNVTDLAGAWCVTTTALEVFKKTNVTTDDDVQPDDDVIPDDDVDDDATNVTDADKDGLPDSWEMDHFGDLSQGPGGDPDGDGLTNLQEYQQSKDPNVPDTVTGDDTDDDDTGLHGLSAMWYLIIGLILLLVIIAVIVVVVVFVRRKKEEKPEAKTGGAAVEAEVETVDVFKQKEIAMATAAPKAKPMAPPVVVIQPTAPTEELPESSPGVRLLEGGDSPSEAPTGAEEAPKSEEEGPLEELKPLEEVPEDELTPEPDTADLPEDDVSFDDD